MSGVWDAISEANNRLGALENKINSTFGTLEAVAALTLRVEAAEAEIGEPFPTSRIDTLEGEMNSAEADITTLETEVDALVYGSTGQIFPGGTFVQDVRGFRVNHSDIGSYIELNIIVPETRDDWKIKIVYFSNTGSRTSSGILSVGSVITNGSQYYNETNIFNAINFDLGVVAMNKWYEAVSNTFSATKGHQMLIRWTNDDNGGTGILVIGGIYLIH
jgi:hypothetical protein